MGQASEANASVRDPMKQRHWTPAMALAWALWQTPEKVDWAWYVNADRYQGGIPISLHGALWHAELEEREASSARGEDPVLYRSRTSARVQMAKARFADAVVNRRIRGFGTDPETGERRDLTANDWAGADVESIISGGRIHDAIYAVAAKSPRVLTVRLLAEDVMRELTTHSDAGTIGSRSKRPVRDSALEAFMKNLPIDPPLTEAETLNRARSEFSSNLVQDRRCRHFHRRYYPVARKRGDNNKTLASR